MTTAANQKLRVKTGAISGSVLIMIVVLILGQFLESLGVQIFVEMFSIQAGLAGNFHLVHNRKPEAMKWDTNSNCSLNIAVASVNITLGCNPLNMNHLAVQADNIEQETP